MAVYPTIINEGVCSSCHGTGWENDLIKTKLFEEIKPKSKPQFFDINKCQLCHGCGTNFKIVFI